MRALVALLAVLVVLKIWASDRLHRSAVEEALVAAYRERAIAACQTEPASEASATPSESWARPSAVALVIGRRDLNVGIWDLSNAAWNARYKQAFLVLSPADPSSRDTCSYDVTAGTALLTRG